MRQRQRFIGGVAATLALAACQVAPAARPAATGAPAAKASGAPGKAAASTPPAGLAAAPSLLRAPEGATTRLEGEVYLDAAYATGAGGASSLVGPDGATLIGMDGASLVGTDGATLVAGGRIIAAGAGNVVVPAALGGADGATLIGMDGGTLLGADGASLVAAGAGNLVAAGAGNLVAAGAGNYALAQAAGSGSAPAAGMWVSVVDTRTGFTVPLGLDEAGRPAHTIYTDAKGRFAVHLDPAVAAHARIVARAPGRRDPRLVLNVLSRGGGEATRVDDESAQLTGVLRHVLASRLIDVLRLDVPADGVIADDTASGRLAAALGPAGIAAISDAFDAIGARKMPKDRQYELMLLMADRVLAEAPYLDMTLSFNDFEPLDADAPAKLAGKNALAEARIYIRELQAAASARLEAARAAGQQDPAAWFASRPWLIDTNLQLPPEARHRLVRPFDVVDFSIRVNLATNDHHRLQKNDVLLHDMGLPPLASDRLRAIGESFVTTFLTTLVSLTAESSKPVTEVVAALIKQTGAKLAAAPPTAAAPATGPAAPPVPTPPPAEAWEVDTLAGLAGQLAHVDGPGAAARFHAPVGLALDALADPPVLYVAEADAHVIRKVVLAPGAPVVSTIAGTVGVNGKADGVGPAARFSVPSGLALDGQGRLLVADTFNHGIRRLTFDAAGVATSETLAGGAEGFADGDLGSARFKLPRSLVVEPSGDVLVADSGNHRIRRLALGRKVVETIMGDGRELRAEGPMAKALVNGPAALALGPDGSLFFASQSGEAVRAVKGPLGPDAPTRLIAADAALDPPMDGYYMTTRFAWLQGLALDPRGRLVVADTEQNRIRLVTPDHWVRTVAGGGAGIEKGHRDGDGAQALFDKPHAVVAAPDGTIYVADTRNGVIRRIRPK